MYNVSDIFRNVKVVELAGVLAGPSAGYFFAELGAEVIKIENPKTKGDVTRSWKLKNENSDSDASAYFWSVNGGKKLLSLDLTREKELGQLYDIVRTADILITNYKAGDDVKLKVDYDTLRQVKPGIIYASISGFGFRSPRTAYDLILQAESGFLGMNGEPGSKGVRMPVALIDIIAGHQLKEAVLIAMIKKARTGDGSHVHVSLFHSAIASLANQATNWLVAKHLPKPEGSLHPNIAPYGELFETRDKQLITFAIGTQKHFRALCEMIGYPALAAEPHYASNQSRVVNRRQLYSVLYDYIREYTFAQLYSGCLERDIPIGKIRDLREVFELPESREMIRTFSDGKERITAVSSIAFKFL